MTQTAAAIATLGFLWLLQEHHHHHRERPESARRDVQLSLLPEQPAPQPPAPEPPRPQPRRPSAAPQPSVHRPPPAASPAAAAPVVEAPGAEVAGELQFASAPAAAASAPSRASIEDAYAAALRQNVDARTSVPDTPQYRLLRPSGAAQVRFALDRIGNPTEVSIARSSGSGILDRQAVSIVAAGRYPPFPEAAYAGESRHVFIVTIEFRS